MCTQVLRLWQNRLMDRPFDGTGRVGIRELRNQVAAVVRRPAQGDRGGITGAGNPLAQLGPLEPGAAATLALLVAAGLVEPPGRPDKPDPPDVAVVAVDLRVDSIVEEIRR
jgi:antitoxin (DNA-binding transcriptional repressor) of toxin-antitoxin stability system